MKGDLFKLVLAFALILFIPSVFSVPVFDFNWFSSDLNDYVLGHPSAFTVYEDYWLSYGSGGDVIQAMRRVPIEKSDPRTHDFNLSFEFLAYSTTYDDFRIFLSLSNGGICSAPNKITGASCDDYNSTHKECSIGSYSPSQIYFPKNEWHKMLFSWDLNEELGLGFWKIEMYDMNGVQIANASTGYQNPNSWGYYDEVISFTMYADWWNWCEQAGNNNFKVRKVHWTSKKQGNQNNLMILSPQYGQYFVQDQNMKVKFQVTDSNDSINYIITQKSS